VGLACCGSPAGTAERAVRLFGAAAAVRAPEGYPCLEPALAEAAANRARLALGEEAFAAAWAAGRALSLAEAVAEALALANELLGSMPEPVVSAAADKI
jgi:hypothetical protein